MALTDNLVAYWKLDGNSNDASGNNNNGTDTNITYSAGKLSNCANFNGTSSKIEIADSNSLDVTSAITISFWVKKTVDGGYERLIFKNSSSNNHFVWGAQIVASNKIEFACSPDSGKLTYYITSASTITGTNWNFVTVTYNGATSTAKIYINGSLDASGVPGNTGTGTSPAYSGNLVATTGVLNIGMIRFDSNSYYSSSSMDEVGIWSRVLSSTEISTLYNSGAGLSYPFSVGSSKFFQLF